VVRSLRITECLNYCLGEGISNSLLQTFLRADTPPSAVGARDNDQGQDGFPRPNRFPAEGGDGYTRGEGPAGMVKSPSCLAVEETLIQTHADGGSVAGSGDEKPRRGKRKPKPTKPAAHRKKKIKARYSKAREDAQLAGVVPTTPDGAVRDERVDPATQEDGASALLAGLVTQALREGWAVPDDVKPKIVDELSAPFYEEGTDPMLLVRLVKVLLLLDQTQWERDRAEEAGKARER
jgi:hypothetical protein